MRTLFTADVHRFDAGRDGSASEWLRNHIRGGKVRSRLEHPSESITGLETITVGDAQTLARTPAIHLLVRLMEAYNAHDLDAVAALYGAEGSHTEMCNGKTTTGGTDIAAGLARFLSSLPEAQWEVETMNGDADVASCEYVMSGALRQDMGAFRASGQTVALAGAFFVTTHDRLIVGSRDYWDSTSFISQIDAAVK